MALKHVEDQTSLGIQFAREPPRQQSDVVALQRVHFRIESRNVLGAIIIGEPFEAKFLEHNSAFFGSALAGIERDDAPSDEIRPSEEIATFFSQMARLGCARPRPEPQDR